MTEHGRLLGSGCSADAFCTSGSGRGCISNLLPRGAEATTLGVGDCRIWGRGQKNRVLVLAPAAPQAVGVSGSHAALHLRPSERRFPSPHLPGRPSPGRGRACGRRDTKVLGTRERCRPRV